MSRSTWTRRVAAAIGAFATAALLGGFTPGRADAVTYTGCLNSGGEIKRVAIGNSPNGSCSPNETQISWNSAGIPGPQGPAGPAFCQLNPPPVALCDAGDVATGGGAYRDPGTPPTPLQDFAAIPYPPDLTSNPPTGFTTVNQTIDVGSTVYVIAICANITP